MIDLADDIVIAFASENGNLEKLANEKGNKKAIEYLSN